MNINGNNNNNKLVVTKNLGYILGVLVGDGFINENSIGVNCKDLDFALNFKKVFEEEFNTIGGLHFYNCLWRVLFNSRNLVKFFKNIGIEIIFDSTKEVKYGFFTWCI